MAGINPELFSTAGNAPQVPGVGVQPTLPPQGPGIPVGEVSVGVAGAQGAAIRAASADRETPNFVESVGASMMQWDTTRMWEWWNKPDFAPDKTPPDRYTFQQQLPFVMTEAEQEVWNKQDSIAGLQWYAEQFRQTRQRQEASAEYPVSNFITQVIDPSYLATGGAFGIATKALKTTAMARTVGGVGQGASAAGIASAASQAAPMTNTEFLVNVLGNAAGGMYVSKGGKLVPKDPDFPEKALQDAADLFQRDFVGPAQYGVEVVQKPKVAPRMVPSGVVNPDGSLEMIPGGGFVGVAPAIRREVPAPLKAGAPASPQDVIVQAVESEVEAGSKKWTQRFGEAVEWSVSRSFRKFGDAGKQVGDTLVDNNHDLTKHSAEAIKRGIKSDLDNPQAAYEAALRGELAKQGNGAVQLLSAHADTRRAQVLLEEDVKLELLRRQDLHSKGIPIDHTGVKSSVRKLADLHDNVMQRAADELAKSKVPGAEAVEKTPGYFHRVWNSARFDDLKGAYLATGLGEEAAHQAVVKFVQRGLMKKNVDWTPDLGYNVAAAVVNRTMRKGLLTDAPVGTGHSAGTLAQLRDELTQAGVSSKHMERVLAIVGGQVDEAGKLSYLKHRLDVDFSETVQIAGQTFRLSDMLESNLSTLMEKYTERVAGRIALAEKGMGTPSDIAKARATFLSSVAHGPERESAARLFDDTINQLIGNPVGAEMNQTLRNTAGVNRMMTLGASGLWQSTEYATPMAKYGMLKTLKYMAAEMPVFKALMETSAKDKNLSRHLKDVLTNASGQSLRLRPYIQRFEDNFDIPLDSRASMAIQQGTQLVPYLNGMKYIHSHQARVTANLVIDTIADAGRGNKKSVEMLGKYGVEGHVLDKLTATIKQHGLDVDKWDDSLWMQVRPAFLKMMDESVLHQRIGDMPAFAQHSEVGKFIFTYRSFILAAHNKLLVGTLSRDGMPAMSLMMMYQFPMAMLATQANNVASGKKPLNERDLITKSIGQMGSIGLFSDIYNWVAGNKREVGAPGLIPWDRAIRAGQSTISATFGDSSAAKAAQDAYAATPLIAATLPAKALVHLGD